MQTSNDLFSFFEVNDCSKESDDVINVLIYLVVCGNPRWSSTIGAVFIPISEVEKIGLLSKKEQFPFNTEHRNLGKLTISDAYKLLECFYEHRDSCIRLSSAEIRDELEKVTTDGWKQVYKNKNISDILKILSLISNSFFRNKKELPLPLKRYLTSIDCSYSFIEELECFDFKQNTNN